MKHVQESFNLSLDVEQRLRVLTERQNVNDSTAAKRCISVAHYVMVQWRRKRKFYKENELLDIPEPSNLLDPTFVPFRINISPHDHAAFEDICTRYNIDEHSALAWAITVMEIFEETIVTHRIFARGGGGTTRVRLMWIHTYEEDE